MKLHSRLYVGWVRHRRLTPHEHAFRYKVFMAYLDLDEIDDVFTISRLWSIDKWNWQSFYRKDYFQGRRENLKEAVIEYICTHSNLEAADIGRVCLLTNLRTLGYAMNPVTFYYIFDRNDQLIVIMPEITNTPWNERDQYILRASIQDDGKSDDLHPYEVHNNTLRFKVKKKFHVSPFNPMNVDYDWLFTKPSDASNTIHLENHEKGVKVFDATMVLEPNEITAKNIRKILIQFPAITVKVAMGIYINALKLWIKRIPFYTHPNKGIKKEHT